MISENLFYGISIILTILCAFVGKFIVRINPFYIIPLLLPLLFIMVIYFMDKNYKYYSILFNVFLTINLLYLLLILFGLVLLINNPLIQ